MNSPFPAESTGKVVPLIPTRRAADAAAARAAARAAALQAQAVADAAEDAGGEGPAIDRLVNAGLARFTGGLSPSSLFGAYADWLVHLAASPGKQRELAQKAVRKAARLTQLAWQSPWSAPVPVIEALPQDRRFRDPAWQHWPYNVIYQSFLLGQQWWHNATSGVRGVSHHHEQVATFMTRQWLDMFSPSNFWWSNPEVLQAAAREHGANFLRGAQYVREDLLAQAGARPRAETARFRPGVDVAVTPGRVVLRNALIELIQYEPQTPQAQSVPLLMVPSWIMKYYILDLSPENSLVRYLVQRGYTVFMISWRNPGSADRDLGMDDYLKQGVLAAIEAVRRIRPDTPVNALGYCLGGTLLAMAAATLARGGDGILQSLTLLAAELDFSEPGELGLFIDESQLAYLEDIMWEQGYLDGKQMAGAFAMLNSRDLVWSRMVRDYLLGLRAAPSDLAAWNADATRMPYRQHREYLERLYLHNELAQGHYEVDGRPIALADIRVPIYAVGTQNDTVSPWRSVYKIHLLTDAPVSFCLSTGGHNVGVVNPPASTVPRSFQVAVHEAGARYVDPDTWQAGTPSQAGSWWPDWEAWLRHRSGSAVAAPACGAPQAGYPPLEEAPGRYVLVP